MNNKRFALVVPNNRMLKPNFLASYYENFIRFDRDLGNIKLFVVDDYSPFFNENLKILKNSGLLFEYYSVNSQIEFFKKNFGREWEKYWSVIPHRTDACRSFGYLTAALWGADVIITIDDDNYAINNGSSMDYDYIGSHDIVNSELEFIEVSSTSGWFNTISMLKTDPEKELYARGYPYGRRFGELKYSKQKGKVVMNVGLWIENPDVDSITVLNEGSLNGLPKTRTIGFKSELKRLILAKGTLAPLNTANTAYSRKLLPIMYDTFQGAYVGELKLDRFGDIWCNLFIKKILDSTSERISIGTPLVKHLREPRNTFDDFKKEFWGIIISEKLFNFLEKIDLYSNNYANAYQGLIENLKIHFLIELKDYPTLAKYFDKLLWCMYNWLTMVEKLSLE